LAHANKYSVNRVSLTVSCGHLSLSASLRARMTASLGVNMAHGLVAAADCNMALSK